MDAPDTPLINNNSGLCDKLSRYVCEHKWISLAVLSVFSAVFIYIFWCAHDYNLVGFRRNLHPSLLVMYFLDFNIGICSRFLPGEILTLTGFNVTADSVKILYLAIACVTYAVLSVLAGLFLRKSIEKLDGYGVLGLIFFLSCPYVTLPYFYSVGFFDLYGLLAALICVFILNKKYAVYVLPVICVFSVFVHYGFVLYYLPLIIALQFYEATRDNKINKRGFAAIGATLGSSGVTALYSLVFDKMTLKMDFNEFCNYINTKAGFTVDVDYVTPTLYYRAGDIVQDSLSGAFRELINIASTYGVRISACFMPYAVPVIIFFFGFWIFTAAKADTKLDRFRYILFSLIEFALLPELLLSTDFSRWFASTIICQAVIIMYLYIRDDKIFERFRTSLKATYPGLKLGYAVLLCVMIYIGFIYNKL